MIGRRRGRVKREVRDFSLDRRRENTYILQYSGAKMQENACFQGRSLRKRMGTKMKKVLWVAGAVFALDRLTKVLAELTHGEGTILTGILGYRYAQNTGMAFSLLSGRPWLLGILSALVLLAGIMVLRQFRLDTLTRTACMLVLGGAVGNMVDSFFTGYVVDMVEFLFVDFAIFNLADAALTIGCVLLAYALLFRLDAWKKKER